MGYKSIIMKYTIIAGVNGVGKSSLTGVLKSERDDLGEIINVDEYASRMSPDISIAIRNIQAGRLAIERIKNCIKNKQNLTQETTLSSHQPIKTAKQALEAGYKVELFYIGLDSYGQSVERVENRVKNGGHDIDNELIKSRFEKRFVNLIKIMPLCNVVHFYDNVNGFRELAEFRNNEFYYSANTTPKWFEEFKSIWEKTKELA